jgi:23S rRNA (cytosine1962-C5)-methyltransferase
VSSSATVRVNRKAADRILSGHPWLFASDILDRGAAQPGDAVRVVDWKGGLLGTAHYSSASQITLRLLSKHVETIDAAFLRKRIAAAAEHRKRVVGASDAYRLVHAEGDLLPGLIIDRYGDSFVIQQLDQGMDRLTNEIVEVLTGLFQPRSIVARNDVPIRAKENLPQEVQVLSGEVTAPVNVPMNGFTLP